LTTPTAQQILQAPKVLLHDHLDGGLRPQTLLELADQTGYRHLPTTDSAQALQSAIHEQAHGMDLPTYLSTFRHTVAVLQTAAALERVADECATDLAEDGVIYAEVRFAPEAHTRGPLDLNDAIEAVLSGLRVSAHRTLTVGLICTALRHETRSRAVAEAAVRWRGNGVVGFDLAGPEDGYPVSQHAPAIRYAEERGLGITLHAGEGAGVNSIEAALDAGASRIGHGVRIIEDIDTTVEPARLGGVSARLLGSQVALEICPTSNVHTGVTASIAAHPIKTLLNAGFAVTVNTDNRLISGVSATSELAALVEHQGWDWGQLETVTNNAIDASFQDHAFKSYLGSLVRPWYQNLASSAGLPRPIEDMSC
jgi:adenosine deaminase